MALDETGSPVSERSGALKDRVTLDVLLNLLNARGLNDTAAALQQEAGVANIRGRSQSPSPGTPGKFKKKGDSLADCFDTVSPAIEEVLRLRTHEASTAQAEQRRRVGKLTQEFEKQTGQMSDLRDRIHRMRMAALSEHRPTLDEQVKKLQIKLQELMIKKNDLDLQDLEYLERESIIATLRFDLEVFAREVAELRRQLEERDEARRRLKQLEDDIQKLFIDLNTVTLAQKIQGILNDWHDHEGHLQMMIRSLFSDIDANKDGKLEWNNSEIRRFVHELFNRYSIPWPNWQEHVFYEMYRAADTDLSYSLERGEASNFARECFEAALQLAITGQPAHAGDVVGSGSMVAGGVARGAMTYSSGVVVDFLDYAKIFQPVILANHGHRVRMIRMIETGEHLKTTMRTYRECDKDGNGRLTWNNGEIRDFISACFKQHGLHAPNEDQIFHLYTKFDADKNQYLDMRECLEMVDALFRSTFIVDVQGGEIVQPASVKYVPTAPAVRASSPIQLLSATRNVSPSARARGNSPKATFDAIDTNHDGVISRSEWDTAVARRRAPSPQGVGIVSVPGLQPQFRATAPAGYPRVNSEGTVGTGVSMATGQYPRTTSPGGQVIVTPRTSLRASGTPQTVTMAPGSTTPRTQAEMVQGGSLTMPQMIPQTMVVGSRASAPAASTRPGLKR